MVVTKLRKEKIIESFFPTTWVSQLVINNVKFRTEVEFYKRERYKTNSIIKDYSRTQWKQVSYLERIRSRFLQIVFTLQHTPDNNHSQPTKNRYTLLGWLMHRVRCSIDNPIERYRQSFKKLETGSPSLQF